MKHVRKPYETCYLFSSEKIKAHRKQGHKFLHIGLVQAGVKPLIREGLNSSILLALRDTRHIRFNDNLLGTIETSLSGGPVHFNCFPNFTVDLHDEHIMKVLTLNIKSHDTLMVQGASQIDMIYRIYYKCCRTNLNVGALDRKKLGETLLIQTNVNAKIQVSTLCYTAKQDSVVDQDDNNSQKVESPSGTDMEDPYQDFDLKVLKRDFEPNMDALGKEFNSEKNRVKREAYRANHTREQKVEVLNAWKAFMREISDNIPFFEYFENHFEWHKKTCVLTKTNWVKDDTKEVVRSNHPPLAAITFKYKNQDGLATPFRFPSGEEKLVKEAIEQNNYTNQCLNVIGKQLDRVEDKIENKVILQLGSPSKPIPTIEMPLIRLSTSRQSSIKTKDQLALEIVTQKLEELVKKEPVTFSPSTSSPS
ncbi:hypothetical protein SO802_005539 [Lithocarpus litseifolius]|uniref:DUF7588 domain-containing protein n=1 Tax=Lithocarpus litseifolius TaxID=425828 RepID=A0AAW2DP07_9ROSI